MNRIAKYIPGVTILMDKPEMVIMRTPTTINCNQINLKDKRRNKNNYLSQLYHTFVRTRIAIWTYRSK